MAYDLYSTDWVNIELLHSEHLHAETLYVEQMNRWGLQYGRAWGVVQTGEDDFQVHGSSSAYEVSLRYCKAVTPLGYIVDVAIERPPLTLQGSNDRHRDSVAPIYLGVAMEKESANAGSSQTGALLDRPALRWRYQLSAEPGSARWDWLQIGRMRREGPCFVRDESYIPQCVHLKSYPALYRIASDITEAARGALTSLNQAVKAHGSGANISPDWVALIGVLISALAPAAVLIDWDVHPRRYLERLAVVLTTFDSLLLLVKATNSDWTRAKERIQHVLKLLGDAELRGGRNIDGAVAATDGALVAQGNGPFPLEQTRPGLFWWDTFDLIRQAFVALAALFRGLDPPQAGPRTPAPVDDDGGTRIRLRNDVKRT